MTVYIFFLSKIQSQKEKRYNASLNHHINPPLPCSLPAKLRQGALFGCATFPKYFLPAPLTQIFFLHHHWTVWRVKYENCEDYHLGEVSMMYQPVRPPTPESTTRQGRTWPIIIGRSKLKIKYQVGKLNNPDNTHSTAAKFPK